MSDDAEARKAETMAYFNSRAGGDFDPQGAFAHFGPRLVAELGVDPGQRVLDVATGRGAVLFPALERVGPAGAAVGVDLAENMVRATNEEAGSRGLGTPVRVMDAEQLDFPDNSFDLVYSHGVLHHTPDIERAIAEVHRILKPGGRAVVMLYHRDSYNYRINISMLRRAGVHLLKWNAGLKLVQLMTGEPEASLREHSRRLNSDTSYLNSQEFLSQNTDGAGNPLARVYSRWEAANLFRNFSQTKVEIYFLNKRWMPIVGSLLPKALESKLAQRWGWHLWIYATK